MTNDVLRDAMQISTSYAYEDMSKDIWKLKIFLAINSLILFFTLRQNWSVSLNSPDRTSVFCNVVKIVGRGIDYGSAVVGVEGKMCRCNALLSV